MRAPLRPLLAATAVLAACSDRAVAPEPLATESPRVSAPAASDSAVARTVNPGAVPPSITLAVAGPSAFVTGAPLTFTVFISGSGVSPVTGTVDLYDGGCGTGTLLGTLPVPPSPLQFPPVGLNAGSRVVSACFTSTSPDYVDWIGTHQLVVLPATTTLQMRVSSADPSQPFSYGYPIQLDATVLVSSPGQGTPTGTVTLWRGTACGAPATVLAQGAPPQLSTILPLTDAGPVTVTACYPGDADFSAAGPLQLSFTIPPAPTSIAVSVTPAAITKFESAVATATVTSPTGLVPTGTVHFVKSAPCSAPPIATVPLDASGTATATIQGSGVDLGLHDIRACYSPGTPANFAVAVGDAPLTVAAVRIASTPSVTPATQQWSDDVQLSTVLTFEGSSATGGQPVVGDVEFKFSKNTLARIPVNTTTLPLTVTLPAPFRAFITPGSSIQITADFIPGSPEFAAGTQGTATLTVAKEDATLAFDPDAPTEVVPTRDIYLSVRVEETDPEHNPATARPGDVEWGTVSDVLVDLVGQGSGTRYVPRACNKSYSGTGYDSYAVFTCVFITPTAGFTPDVYVATATLNSPFFQGQVDDILLIRDPNSGLASGAGRVTLGGDRVTFGFHYSLAKGQKSPRGSLIATRSLAGGGSCRLRSSQMNLPAVSWDAAQTLGTVTLGGRGIYSCVDASGNTIASQGNLTITAYGEDRGNPGTAGDRFWLTNSGAGTIGGIPNALKMPTPGSANALLLTAGNILAPKPQK